MAIAENQQRLPTAEEKLAEILRTYRPLSFEDTLGPPPEPGDVEDLEEFLAFLEEQRRQELEAFLRDFAVEYPDRETCRIYGQITAAARRAGFVVPPTDAWHAATALRLGVPLVTHNGRNYRGIPDLVVITAPDS